MKTKKITIKKQLNKRKERENKREERNKKKK
jgi:hypothetical protein